MATTVPSNGQSSSGEAAKYGQETSDEGHFNSSLTSASGSRFGQFSRNAFFARHNPHPCRVRHIRGLLDCPVCYVNDDIDQPDSTFVWRDMFSHRDVPPGSADHHHHHSLVHHLPPRMPVYAINLGNVHQKLNPDTLSALQNFTGLRNFSFKEKADPALGLVPVTENWRHELRALTEAAIMAVEDKRKQDAVEQQQPTLKHPATWLKGGESPGMQQYSRKTGRLLTPSLSRPSTTPASRPLFTPAGNPRPPTTNRDVIETRAAPLSRCSAASSRACSRSGEQCYYDPHQGAVMHTVATPQGGYEHIFHAQDPELEVFAMLCGILQTDDTNAVRAWLSSASQREKALVLDIVRATMLNREEYYATQSRERLNPINETEEAGAGHQGMSSGNEALTKRLLGESGDANRLIVHADDDDAKDSGEAAKGDSKNGYERIGPNIDTGRPASPPKKPAADSGRRTAGKRASSVKGIPQPMWRPESSLVN